MRAMAGCGAIGLTVAALGIAPVAAAAPAESPSATVRVTDQGSTRVDLAGVAGTPDVRVEIASRIATAAEAATNRATRCSGSRVICSLVDGLTIRVGSATVAVPPRALVLLADVDRAVLRAVGGGRFALVLFCGDAASAYEARLVFDRQRVECLDIVDGEAGMVAQSTTFHDTSKAFR